MKVSLLLLLIGAAAAAPHIVGGRPTDITEVPWQLELDWNTFGWVFECGASIVGPTTAIIAGHCPNSNIIPEDLRSIKVAIIDRRKCSAKIEEWELLDSPTVTDSMVCNYEEGKETCKGDSGGPVVFNKTLIGLVSWGNPKCSEGPGVNVNLAHPEIQAFTYDNLDVGKISKDAEIKDSQNVDTKNTKIFGGRDTHIYEASYIAEIQNIMGGHWCGGAIISKTMILTAAHCIEGKNPEYYNIRVGPSNRTSGGQLIPTKKFYLHPEFDHERFVYDVGVIELKSPIALNENATIIKLAKKDVAIGENVTISGWGYTTVR